MAEQLGTAELVLELNDTALRQGLARLQQDIQRLQVEVAPRVRPNTSSSRTVSRPVGGAGAVPPGEIDRLAQLARELNLNTNWGRALEALQGVDNDLRLISAAGDFNLSQSWRTALEQLDGVQTDLRLISAGEALNLGTSWRVALEQLREVDRDLRQVSAGQRLNLNTSWTAALSQLAEIDGDLRLISAGERLNLNTSWTAALQQLSEIDSDLKLISAGDAVNLRSSWTAALTTLDEVKYDLDLIAGARDLNLRSSWDAFLRNLAEVKADLDASAKQNANAQTKETIRGRIEQNRRDLGGFGSASRDNFGSTPQTIRDTFDADLARIRAARLKAEKDAVEAARLTATTERTAARDAQQAAKDRAQRRKDALGNAVIGGAFPLLFGQGLGASIGGGLGGAAGGLAGGNFGFGLSLVGTAVGQQFDVAIQKVQLLGEALNDPIAKFQELASAGLISSKSQETLIANLIKVGREAEAQALIQQDLAQNFGDLSAAKELAAATDELYRAFAQLTTLLANLAGPVLTGAIQGLTGLIRKYAQIAALDPERVKARERQATDIVASQIKPGQGSGFFGAVTVKFNGKTYKGSATGIREQIIRELLNQEVENATRTDTGSGQQAAKTTKELQEILNLRKQIKDAVNAQIVADSDGNKNESLRLQRLQVELNLQKELAKYNDSNDPGGVLREEARARAAEKLLKIDQELAKRPQAGSLGNVREELQTLQDLQNRLPVTSQAFAAVDRAIVRTTDALRGLEGAAAKVRFDSIQQGLDTGVIARSLTNLREQLQAAQTVVDNFNWDQLLVDPTAADQAIRDLVRVQDAVRKVDKQQAEVTVRVLGAEMATGTIAKSFNNLRDQLNAAQTVVDNFDFNSLSIGSQLAQQALNDIRALQGLPPLALDVGREKLAGAILDLVKIQDQINKIDGTKAQVTVEVIEKGIRNGQLTNNLSNLTAQRDAARQAFYNAPIDSPEQNKALQAYFRANSKVLKQEEKLNNTPEKQLEDAKRAAENVQQSFDRAKETVSQIKDELQNASERVADAFARALEAQRALRSSLEGAFEYLTADQKGRLEDQARRDVSIANSRGIFDSNVTDKLKGQELIAAANSARGIFAAEDNVKKANADLATSQAALAGVNSKLVEATNNQVKAQGELSKAIGVLNEKQWTVNVNVPGGSASGDVVGAVNSRS